MRSTVLAIFSLVCFTFFCPVSYSVVYAQQNASPAEIEDLKFIRNLFNDRIYNFAAQEAQAFLDNYPESQLMPDVLFVQAQIDVINGEFNRALKLYSQIINDFPKAGVAEDALYFTGALKLQLNDKQGLVFFDRLLLLFPDSKYQPKISFHKGEQAFQEEDWSRAEPHFKLVLRSEGISDEMRLKTQHYLAWIYYFNGNLLLAKSMFFELLEADIPKPDKAKIAYQLGVDFQKKERYTKAISWYEKQMKEWPDPEFQDQSRFWIAECYYLLHVKNPEKSPVADKRKAIRLFTQNLNLEKPISPDISRYHRGWLSQELGMKAEAEEDFAWLQTHNPTYAADLELTATRADFHEKKEDLATANQVYIQALEYQKEYEIRNMLLISIIRNAYTLKDCGEILKWAGESDLSPKNKDYAEISYYSGQCRFEKKEWRAAGENFARIPLESPYARPVFNSYLTVFRKTTDLPGGMTYLTSVEKRPKFGSQEKILLLKLDFCLDLKQWAQAIEVMLRIEDEIPGKKKDPWFLLNIAKTADSTSTAFANKKDPIHQYPLRKKEFYTDLSLKHYQTAYKYLPPEDKETRLSILDILINRYRQRNDLKKVVLLYREAIVLVEDRQKQDELRFLVANLLLKELKQKTDALKELHKIHKRGNSEIHYRASSLLAELYIEDAKYIQAIKILEDLAAQPIKNTDWFAGTHFRLGELYQTKERWEKAVSHYEQVAKSKRKNQYKQDANNRAATIRKYLEQQKRLKEEELKKKAQSANPPETKAKPQPTVQQ